MVVPGTTAPWLSLTTPVIDAVVTPCADAGRPATNKVNTIVPIAHARCDHFRCFIADSCSLLLRTDDPAPGRLVVKRGGIDCPRRGRPLREMGKRRGNSNPPV